MTESLHTLIKLAALDSDEFPPSSMVKGRRVSSVCMVHYVKVRVNKYIIQREQEQEGNRKTVNSEKKNVLLSKLTWLSYYDRHLWTSSKMIEGEGGAV